LLLKADVSEQVMKMEQIQGSETSAFNNNQTPEKYPEELLSSLQHGESLKHRVAEWYTAVQEDNIKVDFRETGYKREVD